MRIVWAPLAIHRATEIAEYIALDHPGAAQHWVNRVFEKAERLNLSPKLGRVVPEIGLEKK